MQTISIPYTAPSGGRPQLEKLRSIYSRAVRIAFAHAAIYDRVKKQWKLVDAKTLRGIVKPRIVPLGVVDAWLVHCACEDARTLRGENLAGKVVFGGRKNLERRCKRLITADEWRKMRLRPLVSLGDKNYLGNLHFKLSENASSCTVTVYGEAVDIELAPRTGRWGKLLPMLSALAAAGEINLTFRLNERTLDVSFDPLDLRKLPPGKTLRDVKWDGKPKRGRKAKAENGVPALLRAWPTDKPRPVHPEWRDAIAATPHRALGIDMNPAWIGLTVIEAKSQYRLDRLSAIDVLDHRFVKPDLPRRAAAEQTRESLARVCDEIIRRARAWSCNLIAVEKGLGHLRSGGRNRSLNGSLNAWARQTLTEMLQRKCALAGIGVVDVWGGYSTTIGNFVFSLPDACASAAEVARRGLAARFEYKGVLPVFDADLVRKRLDEILSSPGRSGSPQGTARRKDAEQIKNADEILRDVSSWQNFHKAIKAAHIGYRRPHPESPIGAAAPGYAVHRLGLRRRPGILFRPTLKVDGGNIRQAA